MDNAKIQLEDTDVRAPITGTVIEKDIERGHVIASATSNVSGGTTLLKMADLNLVQVRTLVDETDVGKIQPGQHATITVDAYPNRTFEGTVLKIEPQAQTEQNVTVFPVLVRIDNENGLLRPGMNTEVEIHVGQRRQRAGRAQRGAPDPRDVGSAAQVLGLSPDAVQRELAASAASAASSAGASPRSRGSGDRPAAAEGFDPARVPRFDAAPPARLDARSGGSARRPPAAPGPGFGGSGAAAAAAPAQAPTPAAGATSCS